MKLKKRDKRSRLRGARRCGYGFGKKHRGKGSKGGKGMAGTGKRAGQKLTYVHKYFPDYFGKKGFKSIQQKKGERKIINLKEIDRNLALWIKKGQAKKTPDAIELDLQDYKVLGEGEIKNKVFIKAKAFSEQARKKIEKAGGKIIKEENN